VGNVNVNGMAHFQLNVSDMSRSKPFYERLLNAMSLQTIVDSDDYLYCVRG
jgi:predicted enzyme related to lactoylglutathione lyase